MSPLAGEGRVRARRWCARALVPFALHLASNVGCGRTSLPVGDDDFVTNDAALDTAVTVDVDPARDAPLILPPRTLLSLGTQHGCAVDGATARCWGFNGHGQLGDGSRIERWIAVPIMLGAVDSVAAGGNTSCAITSERRLFCWGDGSRGQRGDGESTAARSTPARVPLDAVARVSVGASHTCAARLDGTVWCWGDAAHGALGREGGATCTAGVKCEIAPGMVPGIDRVVDVVAGWSQTCARRSDDSVWCWGRNHAGQLGDGTTIDRMSPAPIAGLRASALDLGMMHACAVDRSQQVRCWGSNILGRLGVGEAPSARACMRVELAPQYLLDPALAVPLEGVTLAAVGANHSCAVGSGGQTWCWGVNQRGELGDGQSTSTGEPCSERPRLVWLEEDVVELASSNAFSCAITGSGARYCWGTNLFGQLGTGDTRDRFAPVEMVW